MSAEQLLLKAIAASLRNEVAIMAALLTDRETRQSLGLRMNLTIELIDEIDAAQVGAVQQGTSLTP